MFKLILVALLFNLSVCFADTLIVEPDQGRAPILSLMQHAHHSLKLAMYGLTDDHFINAINDAKNKHVNVEVMLESHPYRADGENAFAMRALQKSNIDLHPRPSTFQLLHQKTLLIDQQAALIMTFNFTHSTFKNERNFALLIDDPAEIKEIQRVFDADWQQKSSTVDNPNLIWSPDNSREKILAFIRSAHNNIKIYAESLTDYQIIGTLAKAARSGIGVKILLSPHSKHKAERKLGYLRKAGAEIHFSEHYYIHAKVMIIDDQRALLGSINFTRPSLENNRELSVITQDSRVITALDKTFSADY